MQKATLPFRVSPSGRSPSPLENLACPPQKLACTLPILAKKHCFAFQFLIMVKMFLPSTGFSLLLRMVGGLPPAKNLFIPPPGKIPPVDSTIVCTPFLLGGWTSYQVFKKGGLKGSQLLKGVAGKERGDLFQRVAVFM